MHSEKLVPKILELCIARAGECLPSETCVTVEAIHRHGALVERINLRDVTAVIAVGGPLSFLVVFSVDFLVLDTMFKNYTAGIEVADDEADEFRQETLGDSVNLIMGKVTTDIEVAGAILTVSPPIIFEGSREIRRPKKALFSAASLLAKEGSIEVSVIGPPELFYKHLNTVE